jgi:hypothetical protein
VLAEVDGRTITASDVALARALGLFGVQPTDDPIRTADIERYADARLIEHEASRLGIAGTSQEAEAAWQAAALRLGGPDALASWLDGNGIEASWARRMIEADLRWQRFVDFRFRAFIFVSEADAAKALGPGPHSPEDRERVRARLRQEALHREMAQWLAEARGRARIRILPLEGGEIPTTFPMPSGARQDPGVPSEAPPP